MLLQYEKIFGTYVFEFSNCHNVQYQLTVDTAESSHEILAEHIVDVNLIPIIGFREDQKFLYDKATRLTVCESLYNEFITNQNKTIKVDFFAKDDRSRFLIHKFVRWLNAYTMYVQHELEILDLPDIECVHVKLMIKKKN